MSVLLEQAAPLTDTGTRRVSSGHDQHFRHALQPAAGATATLRSRCWSACRTRRRPLGAVSQRRLAGAGLQHGITRNARTCSAWQTRLPTAASGVAVDLPLHGHHQPGGPLVRQRRQSAIRAAGLPASGSIERTFDLATAGVLDPSGSHFINLSIFLTRATTCARAWRISSRSPARSRAWGLGGARPRSIPPPFTTSGTRSAPSRAARLALPAAQVGTATLAMPGGEVAQLAARLRRRSRPVIDAGSRLRGSCEAPRL